MYIFRSKWHKQIIRLFTVTIIIKYGRDFDLSDTLANEANGEKQSYAILLSHKIFARPRENDILRSDRIWNFFLKFDEKGKYLSPFLSRFIASRTFLINALNAKLIVLLTIHSYALSRYLICFFPLLMAHLVHLMTAIRDWKYSNRSIAPH